LIEGDIALTAFEKVGLQSREWFSTVRGVELFLRVPLLTLYPNPTTPPYFGD